jgi:hypothetical protein
MRPASFKSQFDPVGFMSERRKPRLAFPYVFSRVFSECGGSTRLD